MTFYVFDERGNVVERLDSGGNVLMRHAYTAYGRDYTNTNPSNLNLVDEPWGFGAQYGYYTDRETNYIYCTFRYYDPQLGRWLNRDPAGYGGGLNLYKYCGNNPVNRTDPLGLMYSFDILNGPQSGYPEVPVGPASMFSIRDAAMISGYGVVGGSMETPGEFIAGSEPVESCAANLGGSRPVTVFRGVDDTHPGYQEALAGKTAPRGGWATPADHNGGNTRSDYTSWSIEPKVADFFAGRGSKTGVVLTVTVPLDSLIQSPDKMMEAEVLIKGPITDAETRMVKAYGWPPPLPPIARIPKGFFDR